MKLSNEQLRAIHAKANNLRYSKFKFDSGKKFDYYQVSNIRSTIPMSLTVKKAVELENNGIDENLLNKQITELERLAIKDSKERGDKIRLKAVDRAELRRRIGEEILQKVSGLDTAPTPDMEKKGLSLRRLHNTNAPEGHYFGISDWQQHL